MKNYHALLLGSMTCLFLNMGLHAQTMTPYQQDIDAWHSHRIEQLKAPAGWLNLAGLYWLEEGKNSFGSGRQNKIVFPAGTIAEKAGVFELTGNTVKLFVEDNTAINVDGKAAKEAVIFNSDSAREPMVSSGHLRWTIIRRGEKIGIRLRDLQSPLVTQFKDIDRYPVDTSWRLKAVLEPDAQPRKIAITNVLGQTNEQRTPGKLVFTIQNKQYTLDALEEDDELFIIFGDETSGKTTYPSGRFLAVKKPDSNGVTIIDFNRAYNPPCAFTSYATCPLPPRQNILPLAVTAGEKNYGHPLAP